MADAEGDVDTALYSDGDDTSDVWNDQSTSLQEHITAAVITLAGHHFRHKPMDRSPHYFSPASVNTEEKEYLCKRETFFDDYGND